MPEQGTTFQPNPNSVVQSDRGVDHLDYFRCVLMCVRVCVCACVRAYDALATRVAATATEGGVLCSMHGALKGPHCTHTFLKVYL